MFFRTLVASVGLTSLLLSPVNAQFGVHQKNKKAGTFEEQNQLAKDKAAKFDGANLMEQLSSMEPDDMMKAYKEAMNDPSAKKLFDQLGDGAEEVLSKLSNMDPETLKTQVQENLQHLASPDILDMVLESQDEVLESLYKDGLITAEQKKEYEEDPDAFRRSMEESFSEMNKILNDPDALDAALNMMSGMGDMMRDPSSAMQSIQDSYADLQDLFKDDDKIEEARLQLLADPSSAGNPGLLDLFQSDDMQDILQDPVKFREQVKKGQDMMKDMGSGASYGEL